MKYPDTYDYKNMERVTKYIQGTIGLPLISSIEKYGNIKWYLDEVFLVQKDLRIHNGGFMTMVKRGAYAQSSKQKLNTKSLTGTDIGGVDGVLTQVIWTRYFLKKQGYEIRDNVLYQDNQSAIKLEKNGIQSSSKLTKHINTR